MEAWFKISRDGYLKMALHLLPQCCIFILSRSSCSRFNFISTANLACIYMCHFNENFHVHSLKFQYRYINVSASALIFISLLFSKAKLLSRSCTIRPFEVVCHVISCYPAQWVMLHSSFYCSFSFILSRRPHIDRGSGQYKWKKYTAFHSHGLWI